MRYRGCSLLIGLLPVCCGDDRGGSTALLPPQPDLGHMTQEAAAALLEARAQVVSHPGSAEDWGSYGDKLSRHGWDREAVECFQRAEALEPGRAKWVTRQGLVLRGIDPVAAANAFRRGIQLDPSEAIAHIAYGKVQFELGLMHEARSAFETALVREPANADALQWLGRIALEARDLEGAQRYLELALRHAPRQSRVHDALARTYFALGQPERGQQHAEQARKLSAK